MALRSSLAPLSLRAPTTAAAATSRWLRLFSKDAADEELEGGTKSDGEGGQFGKLGEEIIKNLLKEHLVKSSASKGYPDVNSLLDNAFEINVIKRKNDNELLEHQARLFRDGKNARSLETKVSVLTGIGWVTVTGFGGLLGVYLRLRGLF